MKRWVMFSKVEKKKKKKEKKEKEKKRKCSFVFLRLYVDEA